MGWREDVLQILDELPAQFTLQEVYRSVPRLLTLHPENRHIKDKIRQQLQGLRDEQKLEFSGAGLYVQRRDASYVPPAVHLPFQRGTVTTREALAGEIRLETADALRRGMFKPAKGPYRNHVFLFHDERANPYGDVDEGDRIYYIGQGRLGEQTLTSYNRYLADHLELGLKVHYFVQPKDAAGKIEYRGQVVVEQTERIARPSEGRSVLRFTLVPIRSHEELLPEQIFGEEVGDVLEYGLPPGPLTTPRRQSLAIRVARDAGFRRAILWLYEQQCAVCGKPLRRDDASELEAAHIMAVGEQGPDDPRNGLALCGRHHWAFDRGFFSLDPKHKVVWLAPDEDPHGEVRPGERISLPRFADVFPHEIYLAHHRNKWSGPRNMGL